MLTDFHIFFTFTTTQTATTVLRPFVRDYPGDPVPEETLTHPPSWSSSNLYQLLPSTFTLNIKCLVHAALGGIAVLHTCCYRSSTVICPLVCHSHEPCKNNWTDRDAVRVEDSGVPKKPCVRWRSRSSHKKGQFWAGKGQPIVKYGSLCSDLCKNECSDQDVLSIGPGNHVLDGSRSSHGNRQFWEGGRFTF